MGNAVSTFEFRISSFKFHKKIFSTILKEALQKMGITSLSSPPDMGRNCQIMEGSVDEQAEKLAEVFMALR